MYAQEACADGVCLGSTFDQAQESLGFNTVHCIEKTEDRTLCSWYEVIVEFDGPMVRTGPAGDSVAVVMNLIHDDAASTDSGLGVGASMSCWLEDLGEPVRATLADGAEGYKVVTLAWDQGISVSTEYDSELGHIYEDETRKVTLWGPDAR